MIILKCHYNVLLLCVLFIQVFHVESQFEGELLKFKLSAMQVNIISLLILLIISDSHLNYH